MPIVTVKYKLPEEEYEYSLSLNAADLRRAASQFGEYLRGLSKYESDQYSDDQLKLIQQIRHRFWEEFGDLVD